ncbi:MAG TPA: hypothetical protein VEH04_08045 [Verrucomicrobiae bacterium]|nr:hypothetical protein [Verrucomicrobiae bacterium]
MASEFDPADFVDNDFQVRKAAAPASSLRAPTREEVDSRVLEAQQRLAELKRAQEDLERERAGLEETRRRQIEFQTGRQEMIQNLTRGIGLLEESEFAARRDAEQMAATLAEFRNALGRVESTNETSWTKDNFAVELTRALTAIENARMEWNSARLKFPVLSGQSAQRETPQAAAPASILPNQSFGALCQYGLALTWPIAVALVIGFAILVAVLMMQR